jgi:N-acyl-D-amino-acid deacylase
MKFFKTILLLIFILWGCSSPEYDVLIRNGQVIDGSGSPSFRGDVGINADTIAGLGDLKNTRGRIEIDAEGLAVAPGFINMLSWAVESLIEDGRSQSDIRQGVTLEVLGEGESWGPLNEKMKIAFKESQGDIKYDIEWTTLGEFLEFLEKKGISTNIASFIGTATLRVYTIGYEDRPPTRIELDSMKLLLRQAMEEGAVGLSSALEYVPASFSEPDELTALCKVAAEYGGMYISHIRNEGDYLLESLDELINAAKDANIRSEIYHFKQVGKTNWDKLDRVVREIDSARSAGINITADMYNYIASSTGFDIIMPDWVQEGGFNDWVARLRDPETRKKIAPLIRNAILQNTGSAENVLIIGLNNDTLKYLTGKTLAEIAKVRKKSPEETVMDLVIQDGSRISVVYFSMSEDNIKKQIALPWMSFCSDGISAAPEGVFLKSSTHPRSYGNFARLLGKYVREEKVISLEEAIRKLTSLPAANLKIKKRGLLKAGYYADLAIFDPEKIRDNATFETPQKYATGMVHVFVNGVQVLKNGDHTGAMPGRVVRGPGYLFAQVQTSKNKGPLRISEKNPRYFTDNRGKAVYLTGSHTWNNLVEMTSAASPEKFDYAGYLEWMKRYNHNFMRLWAWELLNWDTRGNSESEPRRLTVSPHPWLRSGPGKALDGQLKFDLNRFDPDFFARLEERVRMADASGIYLAVMLFEGWGLQFSPRAFENHPFHPANNINGINGDVNEDGSGNDKALPIQEAYIKHVIDIINKYDNVLYEISNENHPPSAEWQYHMINFIKDYEKKLPKQHPVGMTFQYRGGSNKVLFDSPADWISPNPEGGYRDNPPPADGSKVIINDTDHLWGIGGNQGWIWKSFLRGLNTLFMDPYDCKVLARSCFPDWLDTMRISLGHTRMVADHIDLLSMLPLPELASSSYCLSNRGSEYLVYLPDTSEVTVNLEGTRGSFHVEWFNTGTGEFTKAGRIKGGTKVTMKSPEGIRNAVLYFVKKK